MDDMKFAKFIALGFILALCLCFTYTYDTATPVGTDAPSVIDDRIREVKASIQERLNVDHYYALTGTEVSDAATGQHRHVEFYGPISTPTNATDKGWLYTKDVSDKAELHFEDEDGHEIQFTSVGSFNVALLTSKTITTPTLTSPVLNTGVSGTAVLDEDNMASDSATQLATQQSIKAYVDSSPGLSPASYSGGATTTLPNGLIVKMGKASTPSGDVTSGATTITFGTAFPNGIVSFTCNIIDSATTSSMRCHVRSASKTTAIVDWDEVTAWVQSCGGLYWIAIGY